MARTGGPATVLAAYEDKVASGAIAEDPAQRTVAQKLDAVAAGLANAPQSAGFFQKLFGTTPSEPAARGLYIWGDVGRGKTMLMDLFFARVDLAAKRRVHFHEFMNEVHEKIAEFRSHNPGTKGARDPVPAVAGPIAETVRLLCFDEFVVSDITDAMLLKRLFEVLFRKGVVVVATSNIPPDRLYWNGLNRQLFTPFIGLLKAHADVFNLNAATDYRREGGEAEEVFHFGDGPEADRAMDRVFADFTNGANPGPATLKSLGRTIHVPAQADGVARFSFKQLCEAPLGARDYLKLAAAYDTVVIDHVPVFSKLRSDAAKRFILLIDTLYDRGVKLAASFEAPLADLADDEATAFEFARCLSRLEEMQSADYVARPARDRAAG